MTVSRHHAWVKVKLHNYVCQKCGMRKVNVEKSRGQWIAEWHKPDGAVVELRLSPACAPGPQTAERLAWLADWQAKQFTGGVPAS